MTSAHAAHPPCRPLPAKAARRAIACACVFASVIASAIGTHLTPAAAQYDAQGRYVPSPMGQPRDPYRSTIPGYTGQPGAARGTPTTPRAYRLRQPYTPKFDQPPRPVQRSRGVPVITPTRADCREGWSAEFGVTRARFVALCRRLAKR